MFMMDVLHVQLHWPLYVSYFRYYIVCINEESEYNAYHVHSSYVITIIKCNKVSKMIDLHVVSISKGEYYVTHLHITITELVAFTPRRVTVNDGSWWFYKKKTMTRIELGTACLVPCLLSLSGSGSEL